MNNTSTITAYKLHKQFTSSIDIFDLLEAYYPEKLSQRAKTDKTERHQNKSFIHKEKPDRMITRSGR